MPKRKKRCYRTCVGAPAGLRWHIGLFGGSACDDLSGTWGVKSEFVGLQAAVAGYEYVGRCIQKRNFGSRR